MEIIWNSLLIAAAVCLVLFLLATAVGAVFFKMVLVREKHPGDPMNKKSCHAGGVGALAQSCPRGKRLGGLA